MLWYIAFHLQSPELNPCVAELFVTIYNKLFKNGGILFSLKFFESVLL